MQEFRMHELDFTTDPKTQVVLVKKGAARVP